MKGGARGSWTRGRRNREYRRPGRCPIRNLCRRYCVPILCADGREPDQAGGRDSSIPPHFSAGSFGECWNQTPLAGTRKIKRPNCL